MNDSHSSQPRLSPIPPAKQHALVSPIPKPALICRRAKRWSREPDDMEWARAERGRIEAEISSIKLPCDGTALQIREAHPDDFPRVSALYDRCFAGSSPAGGYQIMWALRCGRGEVIETGEGELVAAHLETPAADRDNSSYSIGACVDARANGFRLSGVLARYTGLRAYMDGARVRRGVIAAANLGSCRVVLHEVGANFVRFHESFADFRTPRFEYALELSRAGLGSQRVDGSELATWLDSKPAGVQLVPLDDYRQLAPLLEHQGHHVVAMCQERAAWVLVRRVPGFHVLGHSRPYLRT
ncbi:MAG: hypothetical protein AAGF11_12605 [Myxococcota bacterium]